MVNPVTAVAVDTLLTELDTKLIDLLPSAAYICTASGVILRYNRRAAELWGREPRLNDSTELFCGSYRIYSADGRFISSAETPMATVLRTGESVRDKEAIVERPDGSRITALVNIDPILNEHGVIIGAINVFQDVTARKQVEKSLHESESRFRTFLEKLPTAAYTCDRNGLITYFNQSAAELWGQAPELNNPAYRFSGAFKLLTRDGKPLDTDQCWTALALRSDCDHLAKEILIQRPDGEQITALIYTSPFHDESGNILGATNVLVDITERTRLAEESQRLLENQARERELLIQVFEQSPAFMAVLNGPDHIFERVNNQYYRIAGKRPLIGKSLREALPELNGQGYFELLDRVYKTGQAFSGTDMPVSLRSDTSGLLEERSVELMYEPLRNSEGHVSGILVHGIDLTQRKSVEDSLARLTAESERLRRLYETILSNIPDLVYVIDLDHRFTYANKALLGMWGKTWHEAIGKNFLELGYEPWHAAKHDREVDQVVATGRPIRDEVPFMGTAGLRIYDYIFVPVFGADGEVEAVAGATRDVTDRKRMEQELQSRIEEAAASDQKKDEFIALLAHELRNPLAPVRNGLRIMEISDDPAAIADIRAMMDRQLSHMVRLIDDLLDVSRMNRNKLYLQRTRVQLLDIINNAVEAVRPAIEAAEHKLHLSLPKQPLFLDADLTRLAQVFTNLLSNSVKYTEAGGEIWLTAEQQDREIVVSVKDTGVGILPDALPNIFDMFSQASQNLQQCSSGLGIGLALVKALVEMHGGSVAARSDGLNQGSLFTVRLPLLSDNPVPLQTSPTLTAAISSDSNYRILVVDDNRDAADTMAMLFKILGHDVALAYDGLEAISVAETFHPQVILMDVGMPGLNGYDATRRIREQPWAKNITIIAATGWGQEGDRIQSKAAGCDAHLVKPISMPDLQKLLENLTIEGSKLSE